MKTIHLGYLAFPVFFGLFLALAAGSLCAQTLTLDECKKAAREHFPLVAQYALIEKAEKYTVAAALSTWIPRLALSAKYTYQSDVTTFPEMPPSIPITFPQLSRDQFQVVAEVSQTIWDGGVSQAQKKSAKANSLSEKHSLDIQLYQLSGSVQQLFFGILVLQSQIEQNDILRKELETNYTLAEASRRNGAATASDVDEINLQILNTKQSAIELESAKKSYTAMLAQMTGLPITDNTALELPTVQTPQTASSEFLAGRPEILAFESQKAAAQSQKQLSLALALPQLSAFAQGGYGKPGFNMFNPDPAFFWIAGARLVWKIDNFWSLPTSSAAFDTQASSIQAQKNTFEYNTRLELEKQAETIEKLRRLIESDGEIVATYKRIKTAGDAKQRNGVITVNEQLRNITGENLALQMQKIHEIQYVQAVVEYNHLSGN